MWSLTSDPRLQFLHCPISFRVKASILTMALYLQCLPCPPLWLHLPPPHQFSQLQPGYPTCIFPPARHSPTPGPLHIPSPPLECFAPQISGTATSSYSGNLLNVTVPKKPSLTTSSREVILHLPCFIFLLSTQHHWASHLMYLCLYLNSWSQGSWQAHLVGHVTFDLKVVSSSPTLGIENILIN